jgi:hypothetical protein
MPSVTTRYVEPQVTALKPMTAVERAHAISTLTRRLPLSDL